MNHNPLYSGLMRQIEKRGKIDEIDLAHQHQDNLSWFLNLVGQELKSRKDNLEVGIENRLVLKFIYKSLTITPYQALNEFGKRFPELAETVEMAYRSALRCHFGIKFEPEGCSAEIYYYPTQESHVPPTIIESLHDNHITREMLGGIGHDSSEGFSAYYRLQQLPHTEAAAYLVNHAEVSPPLMAHIRPGSGKKFSKAGIDFKPVKRETLLKIFEMTECQNFNYLLPPKTLHVGSYFFNTEGTRHAIYCHVI